MKKEPEAKAPEPRVLPSQDTDDGKALARAYAAFDRGDFGEARALAKGLTKVIDVEVRRAAEALLGRLGVDPLAVAVWATCFAFFVWTAVRYLS